ncbi:MAG: hypothetical protein WC554_14225 [Clostridia bacterium]|jgi:hypothetical protein
MKRNVRVENRKLKQRLYFFVPYNLSPIQQAIQAGHAALEYAYEYGNNKDYLNFIKNDKTWIILNGGTTNRGYETSPEGKLQLKGSLNRIHYDLYMNKINCQIFSEQDLNDAITSVCFLADERVWDYETYPEFYDWLLDFKLQNNSAVALKHKNPQIRYWMPEQQKESFPEYYNQWVNEILGGEKNEFLRNLIRNKKLA